MFCTQCGNQVPDGMKFCPNCGAPQQASQQQAQQASQQQPQQGYIPPQQPSGQPPKKGGKGAIIAIIAVVVAAALGVGGYFIWKNMNPGNKNNQASSSAAQSSQAASLSPVASSSQAAASQAPSSSASSGMVVVPATESNDERTRQIRTALVEFFQTDIETLADASEDYENTYGGEFGEFKSTTGESGLVAAEYIDLDNDGDDEMLVAQWKYNTATGMGYNQVYIYDIINGKAQRISCGRSVEYGNSDHVAQIAYKLTQDGAYIYYTNVFSVTTHEGGFCEPTAVIYKYTHGKAQQVCDTSAGLTVESITEDYLNAFAKCKQYMPIVYETWSAIVNKNNAADICALDAEGKDFIPLFGHLDRFDPEMKVVAVNYLMRTRDGSAAYSGNKYKGYWEFSVSE